jgi:hypothetical protein
MDTFSIPAFIEQAKAFDLTPGGLSGIFTTLNSLLSIFQRLNLTFRVHGGFLVGPEADEAAYPVLGLIIEDLAVMIPGYSPNEYGVVDGGDNNCSTD